MKTVTLDLDRSARFGNKDSGLQVSINVSEEGKGGHGRRLIGPSYIGDSRKIARIKLTKRDAEEIRTYLDQIE